MKKSAEDILRELGGGFFESPRGKLPPEVSRWSYRFELNWAHAGHWDEASCGPLREQAAAHILRRLFHKQRELVHSALAAEARDDPLGVAAALRELLESMGG